MASKYCPKCGYANAVERGACVMCYTPLPAAAIEEGQQPVPVVDAPLGREAMAAVLIGAAEGSLAGMEGGAMSTESDGEVPEEYEMAGLEEVSAAGPVEEAAEVAEEEYEMIGLEEVSAAGPVEEAAEEAEEEYIPPPPPPGVVELEEETTEPVVAAAEQDMPDAPPAPPAPEEVFDADEPAAEEEAEESAGDEWTIGGD